MKMVIQWIVKDIHAKIAFNFYMELADWLAKRACTAGCGAGAVNPFLTPCFFGAIFFIIAFILSISAKQY